MTRRRYAATLTPDALQDIEDILLWSRVEFGRLAGARYRALLIQALRDLEADPTRPGSKERPEMIPGARTYHLSFSRSRTSGATVKSPRHLILYRVATQSTIEVGRILHDTRDLVQHLPEEYRH